MDAPPPAALEGYAQLNVLGLVTNLQYNVQPREVMSDHGLGWTWQCNVFGHYILVCGFCIFTRVTWS